MTREKRQTKASVHYVENKVFTDAIIEHNKACKIALENNEDKPRVSEYFLLNQTSSTILIEMR